MWVYNKRTLHLGQEKEANASFCEREINDRSEIRTELLVSKNTKGHGRADHAHCAQIVPVKVKFLQIFPNETKNSAENLYRINMLKIWSFSETPKND